MRWVLQVVGGCIIHLHRSINRSVVIYQGNPLTVLADIIACFDISSVSWGRCYEPWRIDRDAAIKERLKAKCIAVESNNGSVLWEPWQIQKSDGTPYDEGKIDYDGSNYWNYFYWWAFGGAYHE